MIEICGKYDLKALLEMGAAVITILGFPGAIIVYFLTKRKDREEREYGTYDALDNKYIEFLQLCLAHPDLKIGEEIDPGKEIFSDDQKHQRSTLFDILVCILERAYLMYQRHSAAIRQEQWLGWEKYIKHWLNDKSFSEFWEQKETQSQYSVRFVEYMKRLNESPTDMAQQNIPPTNRPTA